MSHQIDPFRSKPLACCVTERCLRGLVSGNELISEQSCGCATSRIARRIDLSRTFGHKPCPCSQLFRLAFELPAGGQNIAPARGAHGARIARVKHNIRKLLYPPPVRTFIRRAGPRIEQYEIDLGRNALNRAKSQDTRKLRLVAAAGQASCCACRISVLPQSPPSCLKGS